MISQTRSIQRCGLSGICNSFPDEATQIDWVSSSYHDGEPVRAPEPFHTRPVETSRSTSQSRTVPSKLVIARSSPLRPKPRLPTESTPGKGLVSPVAALTIKHAVCERSDSEPPGGRVEGDDVGVFPPGVDHRGRIPGRVICVRCPVGVDHVQTTVEGRNGRRRIGSRHCEDQSVGSAF